MATVSNNFNQLSQAVSNNIQRFLSNVNQLQAIQSRLLKGSKEVDLKERFHELQQSTHQLATDTSTKIKDLTNYPLLGPSVEQKTQKIQRERLLSEFAKVLNIFQGIQRQEKDLEKRHISGDVAFYNDDSALSGRPEDGSRGYQQQSIVQIDASEVDMEILRDREDALVQLESDISDVNQIFKDLSVLVHEQGGVIETIEDNVVSAAANVEHGTNELRKASTYQTRSRKTKCIIITVVLVIIVIIILAVVLSVKK